jgi:hypothetical protein
MIHDAWAIGNDFRKYFVRFPWRRPECDDRQLGETNPFVWQSFMRSNQMAFPMGSIVSKGVAT